MEAQLKTIVGRIEAPSQATEQFEWNAAAQLLAIHRSGENRSSDTDPFMWLIEWEIDANNWGPILMAYAWLRFREAAE